jgi:hypothetical protein
MTSILTTEEAEIKDIGLRPVCAMILQNPTLTNKKLILMVLLDVHDDVT